MSVIFPGVVGGSADRGGLSRGGLGYDSGGRGACSSPSTPRGIDRHVDVGVVGRGEAARADGLLGDRDGEPHVRAVVGGRARYLELDPLPDLTADIDVEDRPGG